MVGRYLNRKADGRHGDVTPLSTVVETRFYCTGAWWKFKKREEEEIMEVVDFRKLLACRENIKTLAGNGGRRFCVGTLPVTGGSTARVFDDGCRVLIVVGRRGIALNFSARVGHALAVDIAV